MAAIQGHEGGLEYLRICMADGVDYRGDAIRILALRADRPHSATSQEKKGAGRPAPFKL
jgi:hypothetical protein